MSGKVTRVSGPLVVTSGLADANVSDIVRIGTEGLIGEILNITGNSAFIQTYEETAGLAPGAIVETTGSPLSVELGPGLLSNIYDGIQRPLLELRVRSGSHIARGVSAPALSRDALWSFTPLAKVGDVLCPGDVIGTVQETDVIHRIMVPPNLEGTLISVEHGEFHVSDVIAILEDDGAQHELTMIQRWPVRVNRPYKRKYLPEHPLNSGQRVIDTMFPLAKGGTAAVFGPSGSGKTIIQHQLTKWSDVDIVVYIGCGERGNEMTDMLNEFPELKDPRSGGSLMQRTVLIANTSDMPVAAREASIYTGITIAEYFRDMGYDVAVIADSTSRWAEALREMSGRLEEMPGEEGYPAYLASRLTQFYERAGVVECLGSDRRRGSLTAIGAVSPPGGDISEPVSQATMRIVKVFWRLDSRLADMHHFPTINWLNSYSLYVEILTPYFDETLGTVFMKNRKRALQILQKEPDLQELAKLIGQNALSISDRLTLETAKMLREDFLQQNAFLNSDNFSSYERQSDLLQLIMDCDAMTRTALEQNSMVLDQLLKLPVRKQIGCIKTVKSDNFAEMYTQIAERLKSQIHDILAGGEQL